MIIFQTNEMNRINGIKASLQSFCRLESTALQQRQKLLNDLKGAVDVMDCNYDVNLFIEVEKKTDVSHKYCKALSLLDADFRNRKKIPNGNEKKQKQNLNSIRSSIVSNTKENGGQNALKRTKNHEDDNKDNNNHYHQNKNEDKDENEDENENDAVNEVKKNVVRTSIDRSSFDVTPSEAADNSNSNSDSNSNSNSNSNSIDDYGFQSQLLSLLQLDFSSRKETIPILNDNNDSVTKNYSQQKIFNDEKYECGNITHMIQTEYTESKLLKEKKNNDNNMKDKEREIEEEKERERERENNVSKKKSAEYEKTVYGPGSFGHSPVVLSPSRRSSGSDSGSGTALSMGFRMLRPSHSAHTGTHTSTHTGTHATTNTKSSSSSMNTTNSNSNNATAGRASSNGVNGSWETALIAAQACQSDEVLLLISIIR